MESEKITTFVKGIIPRDSLQAIFLVGGVVRDLLLGKAVCDIDLLAALPESKLTAVGFRLVEGKSTAPIMFRHDPEFGKIEVTLIPGLASLPEDLANRDFTCNAIAMSLDGELFDPLGGRGDLLRRELRACSKRSFITDPLRIFRALRFEADDWRMTPETEEQIREGLLEAQLQAIPVERFTREMQKGLAGMYPERFFQRMQELGTGITFLPEIFRMPHIPAGPPEHHPEGDLFTHSCQVLERAAIMTSDPLARFCAFFHDLGKLSTNPGLYPQHHGHDESGFAMAQPFSDRLKLPTLWKRSLAWINRLHGNANRWDELRDSSKIRMAEQAIKNGIAEMLPIIAAADKPAGSGMRGWEKALEVAAMSTEQLGIPQLQIETMPTEHRAALILQKRVESFRKRA